MSVVRSALALRVAVVDPDGIEFVVTDRIATLRSLTLAIEDDLTSLVHGDISLDVVDGTGDLEDFLSGFAPGEEWTVRIERENDLGEWDLIFGGVLDLPNGLTYNRRDKTASLQVFAFSKLLDRVSAETVKRDLTGRTGTGTAASTALVMSSTTDVLPGDKFQIGDSSNEEDVTIRSVTNSTDVVLTVALENSYSAAEMTPLTPYYRNKTLTYLAGQILTTAGITDYDVDLSAPASMAPAIGAANDTGLPATTHRSLVPQDGNIRVVSNSRYLDQADPTSDFTDVGAATSSGQSDWTPYKGTEPVTIYELPTPNNSDNGDYAMDYDTGDYWHCFRFLPGGPDYQLELRRNNLVQADLDTDIVNTLWAFAVEYDTDNGEAWAAYERITNGPGFATKIWNGSALTTYISGYVVDGLRIVKTLDRMLVYRSDTNKAEFHTLGSGKAKDFEIDVPANFIPWTFRVFDEGKWAAACYRVSLRLYLRVWKVADWSVVIDQEVIPFPNNNRFGTVYTDDNGKEHYLLLAAYSSGGVQVTEYFIVSTDLFAVIPYANFDGMSCAKALRECCIVTGAVFRVNNDRSANVRARGSFPAEAVLTLPNAPLEWTSRPLWEWYRASVGVTGKTEDGTEIEEFYGTTGDSANRLEVNSKLITNLVIAGAVGTAYIGYLGELREQEDVTVVETGLIPAPLDRVEFDGSSYQVLETSVDFLARTMALRLVRV